MLYSKYLNLNGNSNVCYYGIDNDRITVFFKNRRYGYDAYEYTNTIAGNTTIQTMKKLAENGRGLNGFINRYAKYSYSKRNWVESIPLSAE